MNPIKDHGREDEDRWDPDERGKVTQADWDPQVEIGAQRQPPEARRNKYTNGERGQRPRLGLVEGKPGDGDNQGASEEEKACQDGEQQGAEPGHGRMVVIVLKPAFFDFLRCEQVGMRHHQVEDTSTFSFQLILYSGKVGFQIWIGQEMLEHPYSAKDDLLGLIELKMADIIDDP